MARLVVAALVVLLGALAEVPAATAQGARGLDYVTVDPAPPLWHAGPDVLYLNPCRAGCTASAGRDDALGDRSSILGRDGIPSSISLAPFQWDQATWDGVVACVRATYAIYGVEVVTDPPAGPHVEVMVAGSAAALNLAGNTLGIAPLTNDCSALPSAIAFAFANAHLGGPQLVADLCATAAHEAGHVYGLDHEFECKDPMTYLTGCGVKVFLNRSVPCGEFDSARECKCGATQSSFLHLYDVLGPGTPPAAPPIAIRSPLPGAMVPSTFSVFVALDGRPPTTVELWINGAPYGAQPARATASPYEFVTPASLPDGVLDVEVRVYDDLGTLGTATVTVQKGAVCTTADTCPAGWTCTDGGCRAPAGTLAVGEACASAAACASKECVAHGGVSTCTEPCWLGTAACPAGLACVQADDERFACFEPTDDGGCCSAGGDPRAALGLIALVGLRLRRRRR